MDMDISTMWDQIQGHFNPLSIALLAVVVVNTVIAENANIKASSLYGVIKVLVMTMVDQLWPQAVAPAPAAPAVTAAPAAATPAAPATPTQG